MANRAPTAECDDDAIFVKDGAPVKFCFHRSVTQGRGQITRDVERRGGKIVADERNANVLLIDEQENLDLFRRRYYSSTELYRLSLYVEPRGFVQHCIRAGSYRHAVPARQGMPGRAQGGGRARVPFTEEDRANLAYYLATRFPKREGRLGVNAYKDLERLGQTDDQTWAWTRRHTFHSWREHYKMNTATMDVRIDYYQQLLKGHGHHLGHDPRTRDLLRRELAEEEEEDNEEEEQWQGIERRDVERHEQVRPAAGRRDQVDRDYLARHEQDLVGFDEADGEDMREEEEVIAIEEPQRVKRNRVPPDAHRRRDSSEAHVKRPRVSGVSSDERRASDAEEGRNKASPAHEEAGDNGESQEIEDDDLFGDRAYNESRFDFDGLQEDHVEHARPLSPRASPVPEPDGPPLSTQATLIASPRIAEKEFTPPTVSSPTKAAEAQESTRQPTAPPSSPLTVVVTQERTVVQRARVRGASAQPGPSVPKPTRTRRDVAAVVAPYGDSRARSRSVEHQPLPEPESQHQRREDQGGRGKGKAKEEALVPIEEDMHVEEGHREEDAEKNIGAVSINGASAFEDEMAVEGLLEASTANEVSEEGNESGEGDFDDDDESSDGDEDQDMIAKLSALPRSQDIKFEDESLDSDDAETHGSLLRGATVGDAPPEGGKTGPEQEHDRDEGDEDSDDDDADRIERMARATLHAAPAPILSQPRVTRSMAATQQTQMQRQTRSQTRAQISPRRTRSGTQVRAGPAFPSPGTKARAVVDRFKEEERKTPYAPPAGSRAEKAVKGKARRG